MHPDLENLIDLAIADGHLTEKKRSVILRKAKEYGENMDEVELVLDGKLYISEHSNIFPKKEKFGNIKSCPSCGADIKSLSLTCEICGHDFTNSSANSTISKLEEKIETERAKYKKRKIQMGENETFAAFHFDNEELPRIIQNFPIPNTKEDLFEVLSFMSSKVIASTKDGSKEINSYHSKSLEIITRLRLMQGIDEYVLASAKEIESKMKGVKSKNKINEWVFFVIILGVNYFFISFIAQFFGKHFWPF
jgi:hypothetical protein